MSYRVRPTTPAPPRRSLAVPGLLSALAIAGSPWLVWWEQALGRGLALGGQPAPIFTRPVLGTTLPTTTLLVCMGSLCGIFWLQYALAPLRWLYSSAAHVSILGYALAASGMSGLAAVAALTRRWLPGVTAADQIGPGLYGLIAAGTVQAGLLFWLLVMRARWPRPTPEAPCDE